MCNIADYLLVFEREHATNSSKKTTRTGIVCSVRHGRQSAAPCSEAHHISGDAVITFNLICDSKIVVFTDERLRPERTENVTRRSPHPQFS